MSTAGLHTPKLDDLKCLFELVDGGSGLRWRESAGRERLAGKMAGTIYLTRSGHVYWRVGVGGKNHFIHRIVWAIANDQLPPEGVHVVHVNCNNLDNSPGNLRLATDTE